MRGAPRRWLIVVTVVVMLGLTALFAPLPPSLCPSGGPTPLPDLRRLTLLNNRVALPEPRDFDSRVTLAALLQPGDDRARWPTAQAAAIEGYVVSVSGAGMESANCFSVANRDTHIDIAIRPDAPQRERVIVEVTPRLQAWARGQGMDWSAAALEARFLGRWCRIEGWLVFDTEHADQSEHVAPGEPRNWRATAWELHPVTKIEITSPPTASSP